MACRQIKKEHLNQVAHCLSEYLERLLRSTDYENNLNLQYHDELCINVSHINCCSMKFFNSIVCRKVCKLTDPLHYHKRLSKRLIELVNYSCFSYLCHDSQFIMSDPQVPLKKTEHKVDSFTVYCETESHNNLRVKNCSFSPTYSISQNQNICTTLS